MCLVLVISIFCISYVKFIYHSKTLSSRKDGGFTMRFYILSDLHLGKEFGSTAACDILRKLCSEIRKSTKPGETVLFIILGDIANKGDVLSFNTAKECLDLIYEELYEYSAKFEFVPGNHDLEKGKEKLFSFDQFIAAYGSNHAYESKPVHSIIYENVNFIFADSTLTRVYNDPGKLDIDAIRAETKSGFTNILFCHHTLSHSYGDNHNSIEDSANIQMQLTNMHIYFLFHGHLHRTDITVPKNGLVEIGCGSLVGDISGMTGIFHQFAVGYIQDGRITYVERWIDTSDGNSMFAGNQLYPQPRTFSDPNTVNKEHYDPVDDYIPRYVLPYNVTTEGSLIRFRSNEKAVSLLESLKKQKKLLLLCDAGMGKSIELQNLAYELCNDYLYPFLFSLKNYTDEQIHDLLPDAYKNLSPSRYALLFDGYDELTTETRENFERKLGLFLKSYVSTHIVITSRSNFCRIETKNISRTFPGFSVFVLEKLEIDEIKNYLDKNIIDKTQFLENASAKKVSDLLFNPFYLTRLSEIYKKENVLPDKTKLMNKLVTESFDVDEEKFPGNLGEHYYDLFSQLERVAIAMQLMQQQIFDDRNEYQILFSNDEREIAKQSGLLKRNGTGWMFLHNNFREYLAAKFLSQIPKEEAVAIYSDGTGVKPSWVNTLGYLTGLNLDWDFLDWLTENSPSALVKFESDRLSADVRKDIFKRIFYKYEDLRLHFNDELCDEVELAHFANSNDILSFLLDRIINPKHYTSQYTAIKILRHYPNLFGRKNEVRDCLVICCEKYQETHKTICRLAIIALCQHKLNTPKLTKRLMKLFGESQEDYIRLGMYEYLIETQEHNTYVQFFLSGIKCITNKINDEDSRIGNELFELVHGLKIMSTVESVTLVLKCFSEDRNLDFYDSDKVLNAIIDTALHLYQSGHKDMYNVVLDCYFCAAKNYNHNMEIAAVKFITKINMQYSAAVYAVEQFESVPHCMGELIQNDLTIIDHLTSAYVEGSLKFHEVYHKIIISYVRDEQKYTEYAELIRRIDGIELPNFNPPSDFQALEKSAVQDYFDTLFYPSKREALLSELLLTIGNPDIKAFQLLDIDTKIKYHSALRYLKNAICRYCPPEVKVAEFFEQINLDDFIIQTTHNLLSKNSFLNPSFKQKEYLLCLIRKAIDRGIFNSAVKYKLNGFTISFLVPQLLSLIIYLNYTLDENTLLQLTELPAFIFSNKNERVKYEYLKANLPLDKLRFRLIENVDSKRVKDMVLRDHIEFFINIVDDALAESALEICKMKSEETTLRSVAWKYLHNTLGVEYITSEIVPYADGDFLVELNKECKEIPCNLMRTAMESQYAKLPTLELLAHLITLESQVAVVDYVEKTRQNKQPPEGNGIHIDGPTVAIEGIKNPAFLPLLEELLKIVFDEDFVDGTWKGLRGTLASAFINCGKVAPDETIAIIVAYRPESEDKDKNIRYCNYIINEIECAQRIIADVPKSLRETEQFFISVK